MGSPKTEFDLLLEAPEPVEAQMAQDLLARAGIPSMMHGADRDMADLGYATHSVIMRRDLFVPKGARERALSILQEAWDRDALTDEMALSAELEPAVPQASSRGHGRAWRWLVLAALVSIVVFTYVADFFG